jgi:hypothetical protein
VVGSGNALLKNKEIVMSSRHLVTLLAAMVLTRASGQLAAADVPADGPTKTEGPVQHAIPLPVSPGADSVSRVECPAGPCEDIACGPPGRFWADGEYLLWWMRGERLPPLVSTSPPGTPITQAGVLGTPGAAVLFGGSVVDDEIRSGFRFRLGGWLDSRQTVGAEASFFMLETKAARFVASSDGSTILSRPFIDATMVTQAAERIVFPGDVTGRVNASDSTTGLIGAGFLLRQALCCGCDYRLDALGGYRYLRLNDRLGVVENLFNVNPANPNFIPVGATIDVTDAFGAKNEYHGFEVGLEGEYWRGPLSLRVRGTIAVGPNQQAVDIGGSTTVTDPGLPPVTNPGGLLALATNSGHFAHTEWSVIPEFNLRLAYQVNRYLRAYAGYTYLYWDNVVRAGDQVDLRVNPNLIPPVINAASAPALPAFSFRRTNFWATGFDFGLEFRY